MEQVSIEGSQSKVVKVTGVPNPGKTVSVLCRVSKYFIAFVNHLWSCMIAYFVFFFICREADRSIHDALCVIRLFNNANETIYSPSIIDRYVSCLFVD